MTSTTRIVNGRVYDSVNNIHMEVMTEKIVA